MAEARRNVTAARLGDRIELRVVARDPVRVGDSKEEGRLPVLSARGHGVEKAEGRGGVRERRPQAVGVAGPLFVHRLIGAVIGAGLGKRSLGRLPHKDEVSEDVNRVCELDRSVVVEVRGIAAGEP